MNDNDKKEYIGQIIDVFEDFLDAKGVILDNPEKEGDDTEAIIYGQDYETLYDSLNKLVLNWELHK